MYYILQGTTNHNWYQLGLAKALRTEWNSTVSMDVHPESNIPVTGKIIPKLAEILDMFCESHFELLPDVRNLLFTIATLKNKAT